MTNEEKKALKDCDIIFMCLEDMMSEESANNNRKSYKIIRNLIEKQSKEIEELKDKYSDEKIRNTVIKRYREVIEKDYISKDKIKAKIEEIKNDCKKCRFRGFCKDLLKNNQCSQGEAIKVLNKLLEE